ncbi:MAG TPA: LysR family transcriptional regulator [Burkholderiales bacterium]|nr:LysR family transcriptional regulator [Burkholderiales bacterium]
MYDDLFLFIKVAQFGSFTKAAKELGIYQSTISRRILSLEESLGTKLIVRTANHFELSLYGQRLYENLIGQEDLLENKIFSALQNEDLVFGEIRVMLPHSLPLQIITPKIPDFMAKHPNLKARIYFQNHEVNLQKDYIDLAIVYGLPEQQAQRVKLIHRAELVAVCTPEYIEQYGYLTDPADIDDHQIIVVLRDHGEIINRTNIVHNETQQVTTININHTLATNNFMHNLELVETGKFIAVFYVSAVEKAINEGKYIRVLPDYSFEKLDFYMLKRVQDDPKINAFGDFIEECLVGL